MNRTQLLEYLRQQRFAVQASVAGGAMPQAAVMGIVVTDRLEIFFDTLDSTRKCINLRANPRIALVIGWDNETTVQYEGIADEPKGDELAALKPLYFSKFPDGVARAAWPGITYFRTRPTWIRHSVFRGQAPQIHEWSGAALDRLMGPNG
jgi:uncharacterized protein YhbP (UPF0306 family)